VRAAQIALAGLQEEALTGTRTVLDVLVGEQQLFTSQQQLITAQHDTALAEFNVAAAVGRLIAPELRLPVRLYDVDRHYKEVRTNGLALPAVSLNEINVVERAACAVL
jgi:outer membrane protein